MAQSRHNAQDRSTNRFLSLVCRYLRREVPKETRDQWGWYGVELIYDDRPYVLPLAWIVTQGCSSARAGSCTMCNFGTGVDITAQDIIWQVEQMLPALIERPYVHLTACGSMFDEAEVPTETRRRIFQMLSALPSLEAFSTESRVEHIDEEKMSEFRDIFGPNRKFLNIGFGIESANSWIRRHCVNKQLRLQSYFTAVEAMRRYDIHSSAHILLKPPFLSESEAITDAIHSLRWVLETGSTYALLSISNLKPHTLATWMARRGMYRVPWYWSVVEVLKNLRPEELNYLIVVGFESGIELLQRVTNCPECDPYMRDALRRFCLTGDASIVREMDNYKCTCRHDWEQAMIQPSDSLIDRITAFYGQIAVGLFGSDWWKANQDWVLSELANRAMHGK